MGAALYSPRPRRRNNRLEFLSQVAGEEIADAWQEGLEEATTTLSRMPGRCPIVSEAVLAGSASTSLYRRTKTGPAYRVLFRLHEEPDEATFVRIIGVRHGAQETLTADEIQMMEQEDS